MKIAVIGAGIFGITIAVRLAKNHSVDLFEKNNDILMAASDVNQCRVHRGYHYPRSDDTVKEVLNANKSFMEEFGESVMNNTENYYCIAKHGSLVMSSIKVFLSNRRLVYLLDLLRELVVRDIKVRYKRSVLGIAWSLLHPLVLLLVFNFLFQYVLSVTIPRYSAFAFSGLLAYIWFQLSMTQGAGAITGSSELIRLPGFPLPVLPVVIVTTNLIHFLLALPVLMLVLVISGAGLKITMLALPILIVLQFALTLGLVYLVATANVIFRDTQHILLVVLQLLLFLSPIFYDVGKVPQRYHTLYLLNPFAHLIDAYRGLLLRGTLPDGVVLLTLAGLATCLLYVGLKTFRRVSYRFVEEL